MSSNQGDGERAPDSDLTAFASFVLTYIAFFFPFQSFFPPRPPAAAMGTVDQPEESLRDSGRCDCKARTCDWKSQGCSRELRHTMTDVKVQEPALPKVVKYTTVGQECRVCWLSWVYSYSSSFSCCILLVFDGKQRGETPQGCRIWWFMCGCGCGGALHISHTVISSITHQKILICVALNDRAF